ncbi:MAG: hypothetical protein ABJX32_12705 [Tateyamaria sp.]|uniref:hypothetical protein n=1 Tax=Tateyamaria sp. TaxID=1929288 RepID=UPI00329E4FD1
MLKYLSRIQKTVAFISAKSVTCVFLAANVRGKEIPLWAQSGLAAAQRGKLELRTVSSHSRNTEISTLSEAWINERTLGCSERSLNHGTRYDRTEPRITDAARRTNGGFV